MHLSSSSNNQPNGDPASSSSFVAPNLVGRHVYLRPVTPNDYGFLQAAELSPDLGARWRFRGGTPNPDEWAHALWSGVLAQFMIHARTRPQPVGLVSAYNANFQDGYVYLAAAKFEHDARAPLVMLGTGMFISYLFRCWTFRKIYMETVAFNLEQFASGIDRVFRIEGRLAAHRYYAGRYWDEVILALTREGWTPWAERISAAEQANTRSTEPA